MVSLVPMTESQELHTIHADLRTIVIPALDAIKQQGVQIMSALSDLQAAGAAIKAAVQNAVTLIQSLHSGAGTVSDAEVEAVVADLNAAAMALDGAKPQP